VDGGGPFPDARQTLLLRAALDTGDGARAAWERFLAGGGRVEDLDDGSYRLLPQVYRNLEFCEVGGEAMIKLRGVYRHAWYRNQVLLRGAGSLVRALQQVDVDVMALKGAAVAALYPGGLATRPMNDVDLLVAPDHVERAVDVLQAQGFAMDGEFPFAVARRIRHAVPFRRDGLEIDLHWHLLAQGGDDRDVWRRARASTLAGTELLVPAPEDQLLHTCVHGLGFFPAPVRWVADAVLIIRSDEGVEWDILVEQARARDVTVAMAHALRYLRDELGAAVPPAVIGGLARSPASPTSRLAHRVASRRAGLPRWAVYLAYWDRYRRRERASGRRPSALGYASFVAATRGLPHRRAVVGEIVGNTLKVARSSTRMVGARVRGGRISGAR